MRHLRRHEIPLLPHLPSALRTAMEGGREKPGWCPVLLVRRVRGMQTFSQHELITWVLKVYRWSEGRWTIFKKMSYSPERCRGAAIGLPSNERTLTVSFNSLSHNLGSAKWRKRFWLNCRGLRISTASRARRICMLRDNWSVIWTGVSQ